MQGHLAIVEHLCQASADVNKANNDGWTPLNSAASNVSIQSKDCMNVVTVIPWGMTKQRLYTSSHEYFISYIFIFYMSQHDSDLYYVT